MADAAGLRDRLRGEDCRPTCCGAPPPAKPTGRFSISGPAMKRERRPSRHCRGTPAPAEPRGGHRSAARSWRSKEGRFGCLPWRACCGGARKWVLKRTGMTGARENTGRLDRRALSARQFLPGGVARDPSSTRRAHRDLAATRGVLNGGTRIRTVPRDSSAGFVVVAVMAVAPLALWPSRLRAPARWYGWLRYDRYSSDARAALRCGNRACPVR